MIQILLHSTALLSSVSIGAAATTTEMFWAELAPSPSSAVSVRVPAAEAVIVHRGAVPEHALANNTWVCRGSFQSTLNVSSIGWDILKLGSNPRYDGPSKSATKGKQTDVSTAYVCGFLEGYHTSNTFRD